MSCHLTGTTGLLTDAAKRLGTLLTITTAGSSTRSINLPCWTSDRQWIGKKAV
jgi:hypothetical protein